MSIDATAQALAGDDVLPPEPNDDAALEAAYDKAQAIPDEPVESQEPEQAAHEEPQEAVEAGAPSDIPKALRDHWAAIPEDARAAVIESQREMARKLGDQGRLISGIAPIQTALNDAVRDMPFLASMKPGEVASEIMQLARAGQELNSKPVETMINLAKRYGVEDKLRAAFSGQAENGGLLREVAALKGQLKQLTDPNYLRSQVTAVTRESQVEAEVTNFAQTAEHWGKVEDVVPTLVPYAKSVMGEGASTKDVLNFAYEIAIQNLPEVKAKAMAAAQAAVQPDPEKTEAALKAKSANITGKVTGRARELTEEELLEAAYDRAQSR